MNPILIIGVGNKFRHDDGLGLEAIEQLRHLKHVELKTHGGEASTLMECWTSRHNLVIIDAIQTGAKAGTILRLDALKNTLPANLSSASTHAFGVAEAIEMSRVFEQLPQNLILFGIEGDNFSYGKGLSKTVKMALKQLIPMIELEVLNFKEASCMNSL